MVLELMLSGQCIWFTISKPINTNLGRFLYLIIYNIFSFIERDAESQAKQRATAAAGDLQVAYIIAVIAAE